MKVNKQIITTQKIDINIDQITLLSIEEYERYEENIPPVEDWWWLRSPGYNSDYAAVVSYDGSVNHYGYFVLNDCGAVRPVVILRLNLESSNLQISDKLYFAGCTWTMIAPNMALCDNSVGQTYFRKDWKASNANNYEKSHIKKYLKTWAHDNGIIILEE